jgi:hypothetical protein
VNRRNRTRLRRIADPFVVAAPAGARVRTRLMVEDADAAVLWVLGRHLGSLAGADLAVRCRQGVLDAQGRAASRRERKRSLTAGSSSRWAGAITRTSEDAWQLARRNLEAEAVSLRARCKKISRRLKVPAGEGEGRTRGYADQGECFSKQQRLGVLRCRLDTVEAMLAGGRVAVVRGGKALARKRNNLEAAGITETEWRQEWEAERLFICADGESDKRLGNETIRWDPDDGSVEIRLPAPLAHLANRPYGRYRLGWRVSFPHRGEEVAAQTEDGAVRYDITFDPAAGARGSGGRWYLDASWKTSTEAQPTLDELRRSPVMAVDVNADHLAAWVISPDGNPAGQPITVPLDLSGLPAETRDGRLRAAISDLIHTAKAHGCQAFVIENLGFTEARTEGREHTGRRPSRGKRGRGFRRLVATIPTARFRDRLVQMASNAGLAVIAVDPAYTSKWAAQHWLAPLKTQFSTEVSGHHAAAVTIGRRGLGQRARRRFRCDSTPTEDGRQRATDSVSQPTPTATRQVGLSQSANRKPVDRTTRGHPNSEDKTRPARRPSPGDQAAQDRSGPPTGQDSLLLSV